MSVRIGLQDINTPLTGEALITAMQGMGTQRKAIADGFIYENTIVMMAAEPGVGKSTISTQVAVELAAGLPVFGVFEVPVPVKILYIQTERSIMEFLERIKVISERYPIVKENIYATDEYQKFNLLNPEHAELFIECVQRDCPGAKVIFVDPIYSMVSGGLRDDVPASAFTKIMSRLQKATGASLYYNHHTVKPQHASNGAAIEREDPFYGSQWIKAHVTGSYHVKKSEVGVDLIEKKDNYNILPHEVKLEYDPETELCSVPINQLPAIEKVKAFLRAKRLDKKPFTFKEIEASTQLCTRVLRTTLMHSSIKGQLKVVSANKNKHLYTLVDSETSSAVQTTLL